MSKLSMRKKNTNDFRIIPSTIKMRGGRDFNPTAFLFACYKTIKCREYHEYRKEGVKSLEAACVKLANIHNEFWFSTSLFCKMMQSHGDLWIKSFV